MVFIEDPYIWAENLEDERVLKLVEEENARFRKFVGSLSDELFPEVWEYYSIQTLHQAKPTEKGVIAMYRERDRQVIRWLGGETIVDSKELENELGDEVPVWNVTFLGDEARRNLWDGQPTRGSEYGEEWHRAGMWENRGDVFDDFIAVLEKLKKEGYKVSAWGRSNGELLVSATLVQRPDVMDSALIGYPVTDMLRFHKLYTGSVWIPEYGNPDDPNDREFLLKYSPYHNVRPAKYPPTLIYTGLHDDCVHPAHALKFFMKLKELGAPVYLRVEAKSGHMGASPETRAKELTDLLAFVLKTLS